MAAYTYMRNTEICKKVFELANYCAQHYHEYQFAGFKDPADEPVLALGMAVCHCEPIDRSEILFAPNQKKLDADIAVPKAIYRPTPDTEYSARLIHWSNYRTQKALYKFEVDKMLNLGKVDPSSFKYWLLYRHKLKYYLFHIYDVKAFAGRVYRKLKRELNHIRKGK